MFHVPRSNEEVKRWFEMAGVEINSDPYANDLMMFGMIEMTKNGWIPEKETIRVFYLRLKARNV